MSLYAIGDLHLSLGTDKPMDVFGGNWDNYTEKIKSAFSALKPDDVCVICGDTSWAMSLGEGLRDFTFLNALPGKKILLKGNHDYWWTTITKMNAFLSQNGLSDIEILFNNCYYFGGTAICGTRGWMAEQDGGGEDGAKILARETARLRASLKAAGETEEKLCFFHYPPRLYNQVCSGMIDVMNEFGVKKCWYGHIHGQGHKYAVCGEIEGIEYNLISADYVDFTPQLIIN